MADASQKLLEELEAIRESNDGILRPGDVVTWAAEHPDSELYKRFTWDDAAAGAKHRLNEARQVIRFFKFALPNTAQETRLYISLEPDRQVEGGGYRHLSEVMSDEDRVKILFRQFLRDFERMRAKYGAIKKLAEFFGKYDALLDMEKEMNDDTLDASVAALEESQLPQPATAP